MNKKTYCADDKCEFELNGYKLNNVDLSSVLSCGSYVLGENITDINKSGTATAPLSDVMVIVSDGGTDMLNQIIVKGDKIWKRVVTVSGTPIAFTSCTEWKSLNIIISQTEPAYEEGAIWFKPIE